MRDDNEIQMVYEIQGFGAGEVPLWRGVPMARSSDRRYAHDIAQTLARKYEGQFFGVFNTETKESSPLYRYVLEETK